MRKRNEKPTVEQINAWKKSLELLSKISPPHPIILEYLIFTERADVIFADKDKALVVKAKGWKRVEKVGDNVVEADGELHEDPCYQLNNYVNKLNLFHSSNIKFEGVLFLYNTSDYSSSECKVIKDVSELKKELDKFPPGNLKDARKIVEGKLELKDTFIQLVRELKDEKLEDVSKVLLSKGYGLTEDQMKVMSEVFDALKDSKKEEKKKVNFLIKGVSGSGKSLLAVTLYLEALSKGYTTILAYKNNRLINTVRNALGKELSSFILFYSTGIKNPVGIGEKGFEGWFTKEFGNLNIDLIIFDEAQRMTEEVIKNSPRGKVNVYFYDDSQVLIGNEAGTRDNFLKYLTNVKEYELSSPIREPKQYLDFVKRILEGVKGNPGNFDFRIFDDITDMLNELENRRKERSRKIALICSFTESEGDMKHKTSWESIKNIRIGYPLQSGFDLYKGVKFKGEKLKIKWLMHERVEYPRYWNGEFDPLKYCSSVYGAQGFEADYVGVVWGRDLIWRNNGWTVNPDPITDYVGGRVFSLKTIANKDKRKALALLKNRYYIMLTRGLRGVYVFFEDKETANAVKNLIDNSITSPQS
ncbi:MAG: DNA/RNA helicase domain-containing protein [Sulfolobus sp.]